MNSLRSAKLVILCVVLSGCGAHIRYDVLQEERALHTAQEQATPKDRYECAREAQEAVAQRRLSLREIAQRNRLETLCLRARQHG